MPFASVGRQLVILHVEDSPSDTKLVEQALKMGGVEHNLHVVGDGIEALKFLRRGGEYADAPRPDLILLDLSLPRLNGQDLLRAVKSDDLLKTIPIVIFSSVNEINTQRETYALHANSFVVKPLDFTEFIAAIQMIEAYWTKAALPTSAK